jgi:3-carboxy-cis,cis-muconate cycloisomerase
MLDLLYGDQEMAAIFSEERAIADWLRVERALAAAQAELGLISGAEAAAVDAAAQPDAIDRAALWREARNVGYPIMPLVRMVAAALPAGADDRVHFGATTQDIMDSALALALVDATARLDELIVAFGNAIAGHVEGGREMAMAGRTHAQQAVPTTFGAKMAVYLDQLARHRERLRQMSPRIDLVSLHGAGGTSAALGPRAADVRAGVAARLGLRAGDVPWHVARDGVAEFGHVCSLLAATCARFAREIVDLARTEVAEVAEAGGHHRGASSTMPQKRNPIGSEAVIGLAVSAGALAASLGRASEAGHERAAGEWQIEWHAVPHAAVLTASALAAAGEVAAGLELFPAAMTANLRADHGLIMAEAYMIALTPKIGRQRAHDVVYEAGVDARAQGRPLDAVLRDAGGAAAVVARSAIEPTAYLGGATAACDAALAAWRALP